MRARSSRNPASPGRLHTFWERWVAPAAASGVGRNSLYSALGFAIPALGILIFTPLLVREMGATNYGLWVLGSSFLGILGVFDLGLSTAVAKFVAQFDAEGDTDALSSSVTMGSTLYLLLGLALSGFALLAAPLIAPWFVEEGVSARTVGVVFQVAALGLIPSFLKNAALAVPLGLQRFKTLMIISIAQTILTLGLTTLVVSSGGSVVDAVACVAISAWLTAAASVVIAYRLFRSAGGRPHWDLSRTRAIARYVLYTGVTGVGRVLFSSLDRLAVGIAGGMASVAYYSVSVGIAVNLLTIADVLTRPLMPATSAWVGLNQWERARRWLVRSTAAIALMECLAALVLLAVSGPFLVAWLGEAFAAEALTSFRILIVAYALIAVAAPSYHVANGVGYPWVPALSSTVGGALTVGLILLLVPGWSVEGAAFANFAYVLNLAMIAYMTHILRRHAAAVGTEDRTAPPLPTV